MCLESITKSVNDGEGIGYKIYYEYLNGLSYIFGNPLDINKWYHCDDVMPSFLDKNSTIDSDDGRKYPLGFHIFQSVGRAIKYTEKQVDSIIIVEVSYRKLHTIGVQWDSVILVASEIHINKRMFYSELSETHPFATGKCSNVFDYNTGELV